jgi:hypothetical protein
MAAGHVAAAFHKHFTQAIAPGTRIIRDSPDESQTGINIRVFPALLQERREVLTATSTSRNPNADARTAQTSFGKGERATVLVSWFGFMLQLQCYKSDRQIVGRSPVMGMACRASTDGRP